MTNRLRTLSAVLIATALLLTGCIQYVPVPVNPDGSPFVEEAPVVVDETPVEYGPRHPDWVEPRVRAYEIELRMLARGLTYEAHFWAFYVGPDGKANLRDDQSLSGLERVDWEGAPLSDLEQVHEALDRLLGTHFRPYDTELREDLLLWIAALPESIGTDLPGKTK